MQLAVWSRTRFVYSGNYNIRRLGDDNVTCCASILVLNGDVFIEKHVKVNRMLLRGCRLVEVQWQGAWLVFCSKVPCGILSDTLTVLLYPLTDLIELFLG